jgi:hypothetical protein
MQVRGVRQMEIMRCGQGNGHTSIKQSKIETRIVEQKFAQAVMYVPIILSKTPPTNASIFPYQSHKFQPRVKVWTRRHGLNRTLLGYVFWGQTCWVFIE